MGLSTHETDSLYLSKEKKRSLLQKSHHSTILAVDSSKINEPQLQKILSWLRYWNGKDQPLLPTTVFSAFELGWLVTPNSKQKRMTLDFIKSEVEKKWLSVSKEGHVDILVAENRQGSIRAKALKLIEYSKRKKAEVIVTASRAHSRTELIGLGSFTESLMALSPLPVLVMGEDIKEAGPIRNIFFPTDLSRSSQKTFKTIVKFAKKFSASITLFHFINVEMGPSAIGIPWGYEMAWIDEVWRTHEQYLKKEGLEWAQWAQKQGVACKFVSEYESGPLRELIINASKKYNADLIGLSIKRGPMSQVIMGRTVRGVLANANTPVLAIHSSEPSNPHHN